MIKYHRDPWVKAVRRFENKILKKLCHAYTETEEATVKYYTADAYESAARYFGRKVSRFLSTWEIIPNAKDVIREHAPKGVQEVSPRELKELFGDEGYKVIMKWLKYLKTIADYFGLEDYKIVAGRSTEGVRGACDTINKKIYIMIDTFRDGFEEVFATFTHELVHAKYEDLDQESNTIEFLSKQMSILIKIEIATIERIIPLPKAFPLYLP
jgi:hypothetical protein